jgi:hypothetical protein
MSQYKYIILDAFPLSNCVVAISAEGTPPSLSQQCRQWLTNCEHGGTKILVPASRAGAETGHNLPLHGADGDALRQLLLQYQVDD